MTEPIVYKKERPYRPYIAPDATHLPPGYELPLDEGTHVPSLVMDPFAITITLPPLTYTLSVQDQMFAFKPFLLWLRRENRSNEIYYEFTANGNIHLHGIIYIARNKNWKTITGYKRWFAKQMKPFYLGFHKLDPCYNMHGWRAYLAKGKRIF